MKSAKKTYITYALIMCAFVIICLARMEVTGNNLSFEQDGFFMVIMMIAPAVLWFFGILAKKKALAADGLPMTWKQGVKEGLKISLVYGIISSLIFMLYYVFINTEIVESLRGAYKLPGASMAKLIVVDMVAQIVMSLVFGLIISMIWSAILRTRTSKPKAV